MSTSFVRLTGTWEREDTTRGEVNFYRTQMRQALRRNGGTFEAVCPTKRQPTGKLTGTFVADIPVSGPARQNKFRAAKKLFEAMMLLEMCRPPRVRYNSLARNTIHTRYGIDQPQPVIR